MKKLSFRLADGCRHIKRLGANSNAEHYRNHRANAGDLRHRSQLTGAGVRAVGRALCAGHGREDPLHGQRLVSVCESVQSGSADFGTTDIPTSTTDIPTSAAGIPMSAADLEKFHLFQFPTLLGGVVPAVLLRWTAPVHGPSSRPPTPWWTAHRSRWSAQAAPWIFSIARFCCGHSPVCSWHRVRAKAP